MPFGMFEWVETMAPIAGVIYEDHQCYGGTAKYIEGVVPVVHTYKDKTLSMYIN